jgi:hypothetical protein
METGCVFFEVGTELLNIIQASFDFLVYYTPFVPHHMGMQLLLREMTSVLRQCERGLRVRSCRPRTVFTSRSASWNAVSEAVFRSQALYVGFYKNFTGWEIVFLVWPATFRANCVITRSLWRLIKLRILWALPHITVMILAILHARGTANLLRSKSDRTTALDILNAAEATIKFLVTYQSFILPSTI